MDAAYRDERAGGVGPVGGLSGRGGVRGRGFPVEFGAAGGGELDLVQRGGGGGPPRGGGGGGRRTATARRRTRPAATDGRGRACCRCRRPARSWPGRPGAADARHVRTARPEPVRWCSGPWPRHTLTPTDAR